MFCNQCGHSNSPSANFCSKCGCQIEASPSVVPPPLPAGALFVSNDQDEKRYAAIVGTKNQAYYVRRFQEFDAHGKAGASWNWPAFLVTFYWFLYRKMWLNAFLYFIMPCFIFLTIGIATGLGKSNDGVLGGLYLLFWVAMFVVPGLYGNALYYRHCKKKIMTVKASSQDIERQLGELSGRGGTSGVIFFVMAALLIISMIGILAAISLPAYQDYNVRSRVSEAATVAKSASAAVSDYYTRHQRVPATLAQAGFSVPISQSFQSLEMDLRTANIVVVMSYPPIVGKTLILKPTVDASGSLMWSCGSQDIPEKYLPKNCRTSLIQDNTGESNATAPVSNLGPNTLSVPSAVPSATNHIEQVTVTNEDASSLVGFYSYGVSADPNMWFGRKLKELTGNDYREFVEGLAVSSKVEQSGNYVWGTGCEAHSCGSNMSAFAVDMQTGNLIAIHLKSGNLHWVKGETNGEVPKRLCDELRSSPDFASRVCR